MFTYRRPIKRRRIRRRLQTRPTPLLGLIYCRRLRRWTTGRTAACHVGTRRRRAFFVTCSPLCSIWCILHTHTLLISVHNNVTTSLVYGGKVSIQSSRWIYLLDKTVVCIRVFGLHPVYSPSDQCANCRDYNCDSTTTRLRSDYDVSRAPASIQRDSTRVKNEHVNFSSLSYRSRIVVESQVWYRLNAIQWTTKSESGTLSWDWDQCTEQWVWVQAARPRPRFWAVFSVSRPTPFSRCDILSEGCIRLWLSVVDWLRRCQSEVNMFWFRNAYNTIQDFRR